MPDIRKSDFYDAKYAAGGFVYDEDREREWLKKNLVDRFGLDGRTKLLEIGCGNGLHAALLAGFGLEVYGVDISQVGIDVAKNRNSKAAFFSASVSDVPLLFNAESFDVIFSRGMSWYHYELDAENKLGVDVRDETKKLFEFLKPGGFFLLQIRTDFSGKKTPGEVFENKLSDYIKLFAPLGEIFHVSNVKGVPLNSDGTEESDAEAAKIKGGILIATRKK